MKKIEVCLSLPTRYLKVWVLTVGNKDVKGYTRSEAICE